MKEMLNTHAPPHRRKASSGASCDANLLTDQRALVKKGQEILKTRKGRLFEDERDVSDEDIVAGLSNFLKVPD